MNHSAFVRQIDLLIETYGERAYPTPRVTRVWNWARKCNEQLFTMAVENAIGDCERAPMLSKLKEYYAEVRVKHSQLDKVSCDYCDGSGFILGGGLEKLDKWVYSTPTAFACRACEAGNQVPDSVPRWTGPLVRIVPRPSEFMRANVSAVMRDAFGGPSKSETKARKDDAEIQIVGQSPKGITE